MKPLSSISLTFLCLITLGVSAELMQGRASHEGSPAGVHALKHHARATTCVVEQVAEVEDDDVPRSRGHSDHGQLAADIAPRFERSQSCQHAPRRARRPIAALVRTVAPARGPPSLA